MARVSFEVIRRFECDPRRVWDELVDWPGHGAWIPMTTIDPGAGDPTEVGYTLTAWTGIRPLAIEDRMRVTRCDWDEVEHTGVCSVDKLGPLLGGSAGFTVSSDGDGALLEWNEDVTVRYLPRVLAPVVRVMSAAGFKLALRSLDRVLQTRTH